MGEGSHADREHLSYIQNVLGCSNSMLQPKAVINLAQNRSEEDLRSPAMMNIILGTQKLKPGVYIFLAILQSFVNQLMYCYVLHFSRL